MGYGGIFIVKLYGKVYYIIYDGNSYDQSKVEDLFTIKVYKS